MPGIPRSVRDLTTDYGPIGLVVMALDHVAIGIALGNNRTEGIGMNVRDSRLGECEWLQANASQQHAAPSGA